MTDYPMNEKPDLSLVLTEDIYNELKKRYDAFILTTQATASKDKEDITISFHGGKAVAIGLCDWTKEAILEKGREENEGEVENQP